MLVDIGILIAGLVVLSLGAELLVRGAGDLAKSFGISDMIVGLTVVAFATSAPEFVVSLLAAFAPAADSADMAIGNVVGSNIANIALIVGLSGLILPFDVDTDAFKRDFPTLVVLSALLWGLCYTGETLSRLEAPILLAGLVYFITKCVQIGVSQAREFRQTGAYEAMKAEQPSQLKNIGFIVSGVGGLIAGAQLMVTSASSIALELGLSQLVVGVTIVAFGTSLPELATSVAAAIRKQTDISIGNIIGSCIFNIGFILGTVPIIKPLSVSTDALSFDIPASFVAVLLLFPLVRWNGRISRIDAFVLTLFYVAYITITLLRSLGVLAF